jgi:hypothetical protein
MEYSVDLTTMSFPRIQIVDIPGKGQGVVAMEDIPRGTLILSEEPRLKFPRDPARAMSFFATPALADNMQLLMSFPCREGADFLTGRFHHCLPMDGNSTFQAGLFPTICKVNHTCCSPYGQPNAAFFWNEETGKERESFHPLLRT